MTRGRVWGWESFFVPSDAGMDADSMPMDAFINEVMMLSSAFLLTKNTICGDVWKAKVNSHDNP